MFDFILKNGTIVDGTGADRYVADVAVKDGKIVEIGKLDGKDAKTVYDVTGLIVTSGFFDWHSHSDLAVLMEGNAFNILEQGITTEIAGHCGVSVVPVLPPDAGQAVGADMPDEKRERLIAKGGTFKAFLEELEKQDLPTNIATYLGQGAIRGKVMGLANRKPTEKEMDEMKAILREGMENGAMGLSTGLIYPPGSYTQPEEIHELGKVVAEYKGSYTSHMRSEGNGVVDSVKETLEVGRVCGIPVIISHHKIGGRHNEGRSKETLALIDEAIKNGQKVGLDQYPYDGGATSFMSSIPPKFATEGMAALVEKMKDPKIRAEIIDMLSKDSYEFENMIYNSTPEGVLLSCKKTPEYTGMTLAEVAKKMGKDPLEAALDLLVMNEGEVGAVYRMICPWDIENIMKYPLTMGGIDGAQGDEEDRGRKSGHPRGVATFPRIIGTFCRDKKLFTLEQCIRKLTGLCAELVNFKEKGHVVVGNDADFVVFDLNTINGKADYLSADVPNEGIKYVFVNGVLSVEDGRVTGKRGGKVLLRQPH